jgi:TonB family protein
MEGLRLGLGANELPVHRRVTASIYSVALISHVLLFALIIWAQRTRPVRLAVAGEPQVGIAAYVPGPVGTAGSSARPAAVVAAPKKPAPRAERTSSQPKDEPVDTSESVGTAGTQGAAASGGTGPVRIGSGGDLSLLKRVQPIYPRVLEAARVPGTVVLDAIIHRDGTIGDVTILKSSHPEFAQAAIAAVKQWRYSPLPYEGVLTVTVNFTLP